MAADVFPKFFVNKGKWKHAITLIGMWQPKVEVTKKRLRKLQSAKVRARLLPPARGMSQPLKRKVGYQRLRMVEQGVCAWHALLVMLCIAETIITD